MEQTFENISLIELIEAIHEIEGIKRIRLGSLEPRIITDEFAKRDCRLRKDMSTFSLIITEWMRQDIKGNEQKI